MLGQEKRSQLIIECFGCSIETIECPPKPPDRLIIGIIGVEAFRKLYVDWLIDLGRDECTKNVQSVEVHSLLSSKGQ
jgi:hypothetical protein